MSILQVQAPAKIKAKIQLPASKSISNRVLIINALSENPYPIENISDSDDTQVLLKALKDQKNHFDIGAAGTSMRFLTAYLSLKEGEWTITGTERMKNRPIRILVDALREVGATIEYMEKEGFPPLRIMGKKLSGGKINLNGGVSSQYISALMMIAPYMEHGLEINLEGEIISKPYISMTLALMKNFGVNVIWEGSKITIKSQSYHGIPFKVESDWSAASYWYEIAALSEDAEIELIGLLPESSQGDSKGQILFNKLGIETLFTKESVLLKKKPTDNDHVIFSYDFINEPDLTQTFVVSCCLLNIPFRFTGLQSLRIKETDRLAALQNEMKKLGYSLRMEENSLSWNGEKEQPEKLPPLIATYEDHRMAMAFAPACIKINEIKIEDPSVVTKSYPGFWNDLAQAGFIIK